MSFRRYMVYGLWVMVIGVALCRADSIPTPIQWKVERSRPAKFDIPIKRGESIKIMPRFYDYNAPVDLSAAIDIELFYTQQGDTNLYHLPGTTTTNAGELYFAWTPAAELTNTAYSYEILMAGITNNSIRQWGAITMLPNLGYDAPATNPTPINLIDCATVIWLNAGRAPTNLLKYVRGPQGEKGDKGDPGTPTTNIVIQITTNLNQTIMSMTVTNITIGGGGGAGSYTNTEINGVVHTNGVRISDSPNSHWAQGTDGVWRVDMSTNGLRWVVDGDLVGEVKSNGISMYKGSLELWEEDLNCNVRLYDGTRLSPSLTFLGHTNEWGIYARGYGGHYVAGWSVAGDEVGILHAGGVKLMTTNAAFEGRLVGDISGATGYPEPAFEAWKTNMVFRTLTLSNLVVTPGKLEIRDINSTVRAETDNSGTMRLKNVGAITQSQHEPGASSHYSALGVIGSKLTDTALYFYDNFSGLLMATMNGSSLMMQTMAGIWVMALDPYNGLRFRDESTQLVRFRAWYGGVTAMNTSSQTVYSLDTVSGNMLTWSINVTNSSDVRFLGLLGTNTMTLAGVSGNITTIGTVKSGGENIAGNLVVTNGGALRMYDSGGTNWFTAQPTNRTVQLTGTLILNGVTGPTGIYTNLTIGSKTQIWMMVCGVVTNITTL